MVNRVLEAKKLKERKRRFKLPRSGGVVWANGAAIYAGSLDLSKEIQARNEAMTRKDRIPELSDLADVRRNIDDPMFTQPLNNPAQRLRIYFNSQRTVFILQWVEWRKRQVRISITYPTASLAYQRWVEDRVRWKSPKTITVTRSA